MCLSIVQLSLSQSSENCENSHEYEEGKAWARENLSLLKDTLYTLDGEPYLTHICYLVCIDRYEWTPNKTELKIYNELLSKDSIEVIECSFDYAGPCYTLGFRDELINTLKIKELPKKYFKRMRKKAQHLAKNRND